MDSLHLNTGLEKLECSICKRFLSILPIFVIIDKGESKLQPICGRCQGANNGESLRFEIFENLIKAIKFPCIYHEKGCAEKLIPDHMKQHELTCLYRYENCCLFKETNCGWNDCFKKMVTHCEMQHKELILKDYRFEFNLFGDYKATNILLYRSELFLFKHNFIEKTKQFICSLIPLGLDKTIEKYCGQVSLTTTGTTISKVFPEINFDSNNSKSVDLFVHNLLNGKDTKVKGTIQITNSKGKLNSISDTEQNRKLSIIMKCYVCKIDLDSFFFYCTGGHYVCDSCERCCKVTVKQCPYCDFSGNLHAILIHRKCFYKPIDCIFFPCSKKVRRSELFEHCFQNHRQSIVNVNEFITLKTDLNNPRTIIPPAPTAITKYFYYSDCFFVFRVEIDSLKINFDVALKERLIENDKSKFGLEIVFVEGKKLFDDFLTRTIRNELHCSFYKAEIAKLMPNNNLRFKIHIWKL